MPLGEHVVSDYRSLSLSLKAHPVSFLRRELAAAASWRRPACRAAGAAARVSVAGLVLVRQRPGTASGVIFATLEDETGVANIIVWPKIFERYRAIVLGARLPQGDRVAAIGAGRHPCGGGAAGGSDARSSRSSRPRRSARAAWPRPTRCAARSTSTATWRRSNSRLARTLAAEPELADEIRSMAKAGSVMPKGRNFH